MPGVLPILGETVAKSATSLQTFDAARKNRRELKSCGQASCTVYRGERTRPICLEYSCQSTFGPLKTPLVLKRCSCAETWMRHMGRLADASRLLRKLTHFLNNSASADFDSSKLCILTPAYLSRENRIFIQCNPNKRYPHASSREFPRAPHEPGQGILV